MGEEMRLCDHADLCGGCFYQDITYAEELKIKENAIRELFVPVIRREIKTGEKDGYVFEDIVPSPEASHYRNKMEFSFGDCERGGELTLGLHQKGSFFYIINAADCGLTHTDVGKIVKATQAYFAECEITYFHKKSAEGYLRHLLVRRAVKTGELLVDLVTTSRWDQAMRVPVRTNAYDKREEELLEWFNGRFSPKARKKRTVPKPDRFCCMPPVVLKPAWMACYDKEQVFDAEGKYRVSDEVIDQILEAERLDETAVLNGWAEQLQKLELEGSLKGILHTRNDDVSDAVKDQGTEVLMGESFFHEELLGLRFRITPFSFFQTNSLGAERLYEKVREYAGSVLKDDNGKKPVIYDLYSGTGTITQLMSPVADTAVGVEIVEEAVAAARENAELNGIGNCGFIAGDVLKVIEEGGSLRKEDGSVYPAPRPDFIILDPPRDGVNPKALKKILDYQVDNLIYVACKPASLARDLVPIQAAGYQVERIVAVDMFPRTQHVETVVLITRKDK